MTPTRLFFASMLLALIAVIGVTVWLDRLTPVSVVVRPVPADPIRVAISGAVATPGVVTVPYGARLSDVADAAGGFSTNADVTGLNLAGRVGDGETIVIPAINAVASVSSTPGNGGPSSGRININTATISELDELPGIGDVLAARIVEYRTKNGPFTSVDELTNVDGISPRMVEDLRPLVTVSDDG